jgi:hypothetical protein
MMLLIPILIYATMPDMWQAVVRAVTYFILAVGALCFMRITIRDMRAFAAMKRVLGHGWRDGESAATFQFELIGHCKGRGWQVFWSTILDQQHVVFGIQKRKRQFVLLCLGPGVQVTESDVCRAEAWRGEKNADRALIFSGLCLQPLLQPSPAGRGVEVLAYDALSGRAVLS